MIVRRKLAFAALTTVLAGLAGVAVTEITLRAVYRRIEGITGIAEFDPENEEWSTETYHPILGWTNRPNMRGDATIPYQFSTNNQGLRGTKDYKKSPSGNVKRIAVFGDSCAFGDEVNDDQTVPAYLERWLPGTEVLNFGVGSYGLGQMMLRLEQEGLDFRPDHVVFVVLLPSDIARDRVSCFGSVKPVFDVRASELVIGNIPVPVATGQPWLFRHCFSAAWLFGRPPETVDKPARLDETLEVSRLILRRTKTKCDERGIPLTVVAIVVANRIDEAHHVPIAMASLNLMRRSFAQSGVDLLDLFEPLEQEYKKHGRDWIAPEGHWRGPANCQIAHWIAQHLASRSSELSVSARPPICETEKSR